jgi:preprotein translocase subunit SecF
MELFNPKNLKFNFASKFNTFGILSIILTVISLVLIAYPGLNYGIDFKGGVQVVVKINESSKSMDLTAIRTALESNLTSVSVVERKSSSDANSKVFVVDAQSESKDEVVKGIATSLETVSGAQGSAWKIEQADMVGRRVGADLRKSAILSLIYTCLLITIYMYWRFDTRFTPGALACIFHDLSVTTAFLVVTKAEFSTTVVAALLTLAGYSINDTVVIFDRIRETEGKFFGRDRKFIANEAVNSTLSRTIMTATATLMSCVVLYFLGGPTLKDFAMTLFVGIIVGTYSSIFVATPLYVWADHFFAPKETSSVGNPKPGKA